MKAIAYKQWKTERGIGEEVQLLDIIDLVTINGSLYTFKKDDIRYTGEIWKAKRISDNMPVEVIIRVEYPESESDQEVGWEYKKNYSPECIDTWVNPLVDEYETVIQRIKNNKFIREKTINKGLLYEEEKEQKLLEKLYNILESLEKDCTEYNAILAKINFIRMPCNETVRKWRAVSNRLKNKITLLQSQS